MRSNNAVAALTGMVVGAGGAMSAPGPADDGSAPSTLLDVGSVGFVYTQPAGTPGPDAKPSAPAPAPRFGAAGSRWWTVGGELAHSFNDSTDTGLYGAYSYFIARDVEFAGELALWHFNQPGDNAEGISASMVFRWHFIDTGPWTVYADIGIGVLGATDNVPEGGTSFDFMPRASVGFTRLLCDDGVRLQVGVGWHHISNARIHGDENNPARDQPMIYAGVIFPF